MSLPTPNSMDGRVQPPTDTPAPGSPPTIDLMGLTVANVTEQECVARMIDGASAGRGGWVVTPNLDILRQCVQDVGLKSMVSQADMLVADGMPLIWASRLQRTPLPERVCGSNLIYSLSEAAASRGLSIYLLGGADDTAEEAGKILVARNLNLRIAGTYYPPFGFEKDQTELYRMSEAIKKASPDIIFVALGFPKGERLIEHLRCHRPQAWWIGVGISFSFVCGHVNRAPKWMQRLGLEWMHRLYKEPRRLIKRYLIDDIPFAFRLLARAFMNGLGSSRRVRR